MTATGQPVVQDLPAATWRVMKFGGTRVSSARYWGQIAKQSKRAVVDGRSVMIVVSALSGVTNRLQSFVEGGQEAPEVLTKWVIERHQRLLDELGIAMPESLQERLDELAGLLGAQQTTTSPALQARILGMGELLSSTLGAAALANLGIEVQWQDARQLLSAETDPHRGVKASYRSSTAQHDPDPALAAGLAKQGAVHITQGFIAGNAAGETVLLGRGGSDTSGAYLAAVLGAEALEIWTDVPGMFTTNPRDIPSARLLRLLSYREAQELASMGAKVLHPRCINPARHHAIPISIRYTERPEVEGTVIANEAREVGAQVKAIVQRRGITLIAMESLSMWHQVGFLADAFALFKSHGLSVDLISTSESNVTVSLDLAEHMLDGDELNALVRDLEAICRVRVIDRCASVSLVGLGIRTILHKLGPALEVFEQRRIHLVSQASNDLNLTFVVDEADADKLVMQLHQQLIPGGVGGDSTFGMTWEQLFREEPTEVAQQPWWQQQRQTLLDLMGGRDSAFVYDCDSVRDAARRLTALKAVDRAYYAMKANPNAELLRTAHAEGLGIECVSLAEVDFALSQVAGLDPERILFTPNFAPREEYRQGLARGVNVTIDNLFVLEQWGDDFRDRDVLLRIDPGSGLGHHKMVRTAGQFSKFGIPLDEIERAVELVNRFNITVIGLHAHTGSGIMVPDNWERTLTVLGALAEHFPQLRCIDIGGGLGVPEKQDQLPLDTIALDERLRQVKATLPDVEVWIEPGRYLVSAAGVLLAKVTQVKGKGDVRYVGVATGMNSLIRPALYGAYHEIVNLTRLDEPHEQISNIVGPICETGDVLGLDRVLPDSVEGDVMLIANAGAYAAAMASRYNLREPAEELVLGADASAALRAAAR